MGLRGPKDYLKLGSMNVVCDRCAHKAKLEDLVTEWTGLKVHPHCLEPRHPQDFLKAVPDGRAKAYYRPVPTEEFLPFEIQDFIDDGNTPITYLTDGNGNYLTDAYGNKLYVVGIFR